MVYGISAGGVTELVFVFGYGIGGCECYNMILSVLIISIQNPTPSGVSSD